MQCNPTYNALPLNNVCDTFQKKNGTPPLPSPPLPVNIPIH